MKVRALINLVFVAVLLGTLVTPALAIEVCYDYVYYRVSGTDPSPPGRADKPYLGKTQLTDFLQHKLQYALLPYKPAGHELKRGDVIFLPGHVGIANGPDNIDHFIIVEGTSRSNLRYSPQPNTMPAHKNLGGKVGGLYHGDTLRDFRMRQFSAQRSGIPSDYTVWRRKANSSGGVIQVVSGTYGANCKQPTGNKTAHLATACNGKADCTYAIDWKVIGDPAVGCRKTYEAQYRCSGDPTIHSTSAGAEAGYGSKIRLDCKR